MTKQIKEPTTENKEKDLVTLIEYYKKGYSIMEIAEIMDVSFAYLSKIKEESIQSNTWLTPEELKSIEGKNFFKLQEKKDNTLQKHVKDLITFKELYKKGYSIIEIAEIMKVSDNYLIKIKKEGIKANIWLTPEELKSIEEKKLLKRQEKKNSTLQKHEKDLVTLIEYYKKGYPINKIARIMKVSGSYLYTIRRESIQANTWLTPEELKSIEEKKLLKNQEQKDSTLQKNKEDIAKINNYLKMYKKYKKIVQNDKYASIETRSNFIKILVKLNKLNVPISEEDMNLILDNIYIYPELASNANIKLLILNANKIGGLKSVIKMTNKLINVLNDTKLYDILVKYKSLIEKNILLPKIQSMKEKGLSNTTIGEKLGLTSIEVNNILNENIKTSLRNDEK